MFNLCVICKKGENLLVCSGCQLIVHGKCLKCDTTFENENFYCPVCAFSRASYALVEAANEVQKAKDELDAFLYSISSSIGSASLPASPLPASPLEVGSPSQLRPRPPLWSKEENKKLAEGVTVYPVDEDGRWTKILAFGSNVFEKGRIPYELKARWRKICKRKRMCTNSVPRI